MSAPDQALAALPAIPRGEDGSAFPAPWAARAFALAVALNKRGLFIWSEWSDALGAEFARDADADTGDPEAYWRAWLAALESLLAKKKVASAADLVTLREAWRDAAERTPHGRPIEPPARPRNDRWLGRRADCCRGIAAAGRASFSGL